MRQLPYYDEATGLYVSNDLTTKPQSRVLTGIRWLKAAFWGSPRLIQLAIIAITCSVFVVGVTASIKLIADIGVNNPSGTRAATKAKQTVRGSSSKLSPAVLQQPSKTISSQSSTTNKPTTSSTAKSTTGGTSTASGTKSSSGGGSGGSGGGGSTPYVQPDTQGFRGNVSSLTTYSLANGKIPPGTTDCSWNQTFGYLRCNDTNLNLSNIHLLGSLYWAGCGSLTISNSVFDWQVPSFNNWFMVDNACSSPSGSSAITVTSSTFETGPTVPTYTGGSDIGAINENTGAVPMIISNSLIQGFPQGLDPGGSSVIKNNEIYANDATCGSGICHVDGLFSQGGDNISYQGNYITAAADGTSAIFFQTSPNTTGDSVIGNYIKGGSYTLYNENANSLVVQNNTFGGYTYGDCDLYAGASWGTWSGNIKADGTPVNPSGNGCN